MAFEYLVLYVLLTVQIDSVKVRNSRILQNYFCLG